MLVSKGAAVGEIEGDEMRHRLREESEKGSVDGSQIGKIEMPHGRSGRMLGELADTRRSDISAS